MANETFGMQQTLASTQGTDVFGPTFDSPAAQPDSFRGSATAGLILGILSTYTWLLPIVGFPLAIAGIVLSVKGRRSATVRIMGTIGLVLAIIGLVLALANAALGAFLVLHAKTR
jgi:hypothetical protein